MIKNKIIYNKNITLTIIMIFTIIFALGCNSSKKDSSTQNDTFKITNENHLNNNNKNNNKIITKSKTFLPTTGNEPEFDADYWNYENSYHLYTNCYFYAIHKPISSSKYYEGMGPGYFSNTTIKNYYSRSSYTKQIIKAFRNDMRKFGRRFHDLRIYYARGKYEMRPRCYKIALFIRYNSSGFTNDYHFVRQDESGYWSHKMGEGVDLEDNYKKAFVTMFDFSGKYIIDPSKSDFGTYKFEGYFAISH